MSVIMRKTGSLLASCHFVTESLKVKVDSHKNVEMIHAARDAIGPEVELMADIYLRWDVDYTRRFAEEASDVCLKWIEEPIPLDDYAGMAQLVREIQPTWIVSGEHEFTRYGFRELLRWKAADMIQPDVSWAGGFNGMSTHCSGSRCIRYSDMAPSSGYTVGLASYCLSSDAVYGRNLRSFPRWR